MSEPKSTQPQAAPERCQIPVTVNGQPRRFSAYPMERLLDVLRNQLGLTGVKEGCGEGECGSCSVLMNGSLVNSCLIPVLQARNTVLLTIEGLAAGGQLDALQQAFLDLGGAQCGICTPGMILAAHQLLASHPQPSLAQIREGLSGNLCRCTGYTQIFEAVAQAARRRAAP